MVNGRVVDRKPMIGLIGRAVAMVQTMGTSAAVVVDTMALGVRQDSGVVGVARGGMAQVEPEGADATQ